MIDLKGFRFPIKPTVQLLDPKRTTKRPGSIV